MTFAAITITMRAMEFRLWDTLFNLVMLAFWYQIWRRPGHTDIYNPFISAVIRPTQAVLQFLKPVFTGLSSRLISIIMLLVLVLFRALAAPRDAGQWQLLFGFEKGAPDELHLAPHIVFSVLSFAMFLFKMWGLSLIFVRRDGDEHAEHTTSALFYFSRPFTDLPLKWRPVTLYCFGVLLALSLDLSNIARTAETTALVLILKSTVSSLAAWVDLLMLLVNLMVILIIGSWVTLIAGSPEMMYFCKSWMDLILGPFRRFPLVLGPLDLTPIIYMLVVSFVWFFLKVILGQSYLGLTT